VVETLQTNRTDAVHLLDQIVRQLPDGIYLRSVKQVDTKVTLIGFAQSNARVSTLMRNIESSPWITKPELVEVKLVPMPGAANQRATDQKVSEFTLNFEVKRETPSVDNAPKAAGARGGKA
jgi:type IV pilus assembly protein PilN